MNWKDHDQIWRSIEALTNDVTVTHATLTVLNDNTDKLVAAIRDLIDRIPPENSR